MLHLLKNKKAAYILLSLFAHYSVYKSIRYVSIETEKLEILRDGILKAKGFRLQMT